MAKSVPAWATIASHLADNYLTFTLGIMAPTYIACFYSALNGVWMRQSSGGAHGIIWYNWKGYDEPLKETKMKLRCD